MGNLSNKLECLFREYLIRKEKERLTPSTYSYGNYHHSSSSWMQNDDKYDGVIYFYELSDINRAPQLFYNIGAFDAFLRRYGIFMPPFQKDIIKQLERSYISCKKGTHDLLIRGTRELLMTAMSRSDSQGVDQETAGQAIMNAPIRVPGIHLFNQDNLLERKPPMYSGYPDQWYG